MTELLDLNMEYRNVSHGSKLKRLFIDFPRQLVYDKLHRDPDAFREYGLHIIAGKQGTGKTLLAVYLLMYYKRLYPAMKVKTNFNYVYEDGVIESCDDIIASTNGVYGEIDAIDELQNWFNSNESRNFPPEMLGEITQQRKQRKVILGTTQVFERVAKPLREQTYMLYRPSTIAGCLTLVFKFEVLIKASDGTMDKKKLRGFFFFVHDQKIRESYDTYLKIERMTSSGFKPTDQQMSVLSAQNMSFNFPRKFGK